MRKNRISEVISNINLKYVDEAAYVGYETVVHRSGWVKWKLPTSSSMRFIRIMTAVS